MGQVGVELLGVPDLAGLWKDVPLAPGVEDKLQPHGAAPHLCQALVALPGELLQLLAGGGAGQLDPGQGGAQPGTAALLQQAEDRAGLQGMGRHLDEWNMLLQCCYIVVDPIAFH